MNPSKNEIGNKYGKLTVIKRGGSTINQSVKWICNCECGNEVEIIGANLRNGSSTSCGCSRGRKEEFDGSAVFKKNYSTLKRVCKSSKKELELNFKEWYDLVNQNCHYCGLSPYDKRYSYSKKRYSKGVDQDNVEVFNGVDRIDSSKGYIKGNVVSCCTMCNRMKSDFDQKEFIKQIELIYNKWKTKTVFAS